MRYRIVYLIITFQLFFSSASFAQACTNLGQTPPTAFPVCGTKTFDQVDVPICSSVSLFVPGCSNGGSSANYENKNPYWYKFTCYQTGNLGFVLTPINAGDDYDWQLYDVTGLNPNQVLTNTSIIVSGNWAGTYGSTGAAAGGVNFIQCASDPNANRPSFAAMPTIILGHDYILLISHFTDSQSGYSLSFGGGTASITDPLEPHLLSSSAPCDGTEIRIKTNKKMKCNSLSLDGSDFSVTAPGGAIINPIAASSVQCAGGFDLDSLSIFMSAALAPGTYTVKIKNGADGNTLKDNCDRTIPVDEAVQFTVFPLIPTPMDSLTTPKCAPQTLELVFKKKIKCSTVAADGSDFFITGSYPVIITGATTNCVSGGTTKIILQLSTPMQVGGDFLVNLQNGSDGNPIADECDVQTTLPDDVAFSVKDTVNATFGYTINYTCTKNTVFYTYPNNSVNAWAWAFGSVLNSSLQNPTIVYTNFEPKTTTLMVSNGVCSDTASTTIVFDNYVKANFDVTAVVCPNKVVFFNNTSIGNITNWTWTFGNGIILNVKNPVPQVYTPLPANDYNAMPTLIVKNNYGCLDTIAKPVQIVYSCFIAVPSAFTPNGDGKNDFLYPLKAYKSSNLSFSVYNRLGQRVFYANDWQQKWDGKYKGMPQIPGTYVWTLDYLNIESNKRVFEKGTSILIR